MAMVFNIVSKKAVQLSSIIVTATTGSTITLTKPNGTTITGTEISGTWTFAELADFGTYTISATLGTRSSTQSVVISTAGTYSVTITYPKLPNAYQEVEYLQSDGTAYIDTGFVPSSTAYERVVIKASPTNTSSLSILCGAWYLGDYRPILCAFGTIDGAHRPCFGAGDKNELTCYTSLSSDTSTQYIFDITAQNGTVSGTINSTYSASASYTASQLLAENLSSLLFGYQSYYDGNTHYYPYASKIYSAQFYDTSATDLKRNFVPCYRKSDLVAGMYDLVSETFYTNAASSGSFTVGGDVN